jgi:hypothetical protein
MRTGRSLLAAALVGACGGAPPAVPSATGGPAPGDPTPRSVQVTIEFDPALPAPARLQVVHESGEHRDVATQCTGVALSLPPGPVLLRLVAGERSLERALLVQPGMSALAWDLSSMQQSP